MAADGWFATGTDYRSARSRQESARSEVQKPKACDRAAASGERICSTSKIPPKWARRTKGCSMPCCPFSHLCAGISAGDFQEALAAPLGKEAPNLFQAAGDRSASRANGWTHIDDGGSAISSCAPI